MLDVTYVKEVTLIESARWNHHLKSKLITRIPRRHNFNSNHYTLRYKDHNNSRHYCGNQGPPRNSYNQPAYEKKLNLEDMFQQFMQTHSNFVDRTETRFKQYNAQFKNQEASIKNIENQPRQISQQLAERPQGSLPSNTIANPRNEHVNVITLRSGKELVEPKQPEETPSIEAEALKRQKYKIPMRHDRGERDEEKTLVSVVPPAYDLPIPYPQRVKQQKKEQ